MTSEKRTDTATPQTPADEIDELLRRHDLYAEIAEPFNHRYGVIIRSADGKPLWSRRHHDLKTLSDMTLKYLRNYRNNE